MPAGEPFTRLCQALASAGPAAGRADLHLHTTHSDGTYTPAQVVEVARRSGLSAIAITDHDTTTGVADARAAAGPHLEVIAGVEVTAEIENREVHLLGYFVRPDDAALTAALGRLCDERRGRFRAMVERLRERGVSIDDADLPTANGPSALGRRTLAVLLERTGQVATVREAFNRYLADDGPVHVPKARLPLADAIALVRGAGGVASLAHPSAALTLPQLIEQKAMGLRAIEAEYPSFKPSRVRLLRSWASELGLAITGGSDCHGPDVLKRVVGTRTMTMDEVAALRRFAEG